MIKIKFHFYILFIFVFNFSKAQTHRYLLTNIFDENPSPSVVKNGTFEFDTTFSSSNSTWEIDWPEHTVFNAIFKYTHPSNINQSYEMRIGKGGQIYSFKHSGFGEALPPQWRPSFDDNGNNTVDPGFSNPIQSNHGNWAPWNDEVWQLAGSDQRDSLNGKVVTKNIHQAGPYMNNYAHRASDLTTTPFYSPMVQNYFDKANEYYVTVNWGQSENPSYVFDEFSDCDVCYTDAFKPSVLYYNRYKNIGEGILQVDFLIFNYHRTRGVDFWNVPFVGIRNSSLPFAFISNSRTDVTSYQVLNSKAGHPIVSDEASYLPEFSQGTFVKVSGNNATSSGWFAVSNTSMGNGPTLAFVTSKATTNPTNGYGDIRYGTAMSNPLRDVTIFTRRANGGAVDPQTKLKHWGILAGEAIKGRYFILVNNNISNITNNINTYNLTTNAYVEIVKIDSIENNNLYYEFVRYSSDSIIPRLTTKENASLSLNSVPFNNSYPVYLVTTSNKSLLTSNPYEVTLKPYDGQIKKIELLGFSTILKSNTIVEYVSSLHSPKNAKVILYPNPSSRFVTIQTDISDKENIIITNLLGEVIQHNEVQFISTDTGIKLDMLNLKKGVYFIIIENSFYRLIKN